MSDGGEAAGIDLDDMIAKSRRSLAAGYVHLHDDDFDFASARAYYAVFYAMEAVLKTRGLRLAKHSGVISSFNKEFVKTSVFPQEFGKLATRLLRNREIGDYRYDVCITKDQAAEDIAIAERIMKQIKEYLVNKGFLVKSGKETEPDKNISHGDAEFTEKE